MNSVLWYRGLLVQQRYNTFKHRIVHLGFPTDSIISPRRSRRNAEVTCGFAEGARCRMREAASGEQSASIPGSSAIGWIRILIGSRRVPRFIYQHTPQRKDGVRRSPGVVGAVFPCAGLIAMVIHLVNIDAVQRRRVARKI